MGVFQMELFDNRINLKIDILHTIMNETNYISSKEIQRRIQTSNVETIQYICHEMNEEFMYNIDKTPLLEVHIGEGFKFVGKHQLIPKYISFLYMDDLNYKIVVDSFFNQSSIGVFCVVHSISYSTLRRRVIHINEIIKPLGLTLQYKKNLSITGQESIRRVYLFFLINYVIDDLSDVPHLVNEHHYSSISRKIITELNFPVASHQIKSFVLWLYIVDYSIQKGNPLEYLAPSSQRMVEDSVYPPKPEAFEYWKMNEWRFFCIFNSINGVFNESSMIDLVIFKDEVSNAFSLWLELFELHFKKLSQEEIDFSLLKIVQFILLISFINVDENMSILILRTNQLIKKPHPELFYKFNIMWDEYLSLKTPFTHPFFKQMSYLLVRNLFYSEELRTPIYLYLRITSGTMVGNYVKSLIQKRFSIDFNIYFVEKSDLADLIISASTFIKPTDKSVVYVVDRLGESDYERVEKSLIEIVTKKVVQYNKKDLELEVGE